MIKICLPSSKSPYILTFHYNQHIFGGQRRQILPNQYKYKEKGISDPTSRSNLKIVEFQFHSFDMLILSKLGTGIA